MPNLERQTDDTCQNVTNSSESEASELKIDPTEQHFFNYVFLVNDI